MSWSLILYVLTAALRDKLILSLGLLLVIAFSLSVFLGSSAITEQDQFALVFTAAGLRIGGVLALVLFVCTFVRRCFESREIEYLLSRPISRPSLIFSFAAAFSCMAVLSGGALMLTLLLVLNNPPDAGYVLWGASVAVEFIIMVNVALFFALVLSSAASAAFMCMAFYVLARLIGQILGILDAGTAGAMVWLEKVMEIISIFIPRLDLMGQTSWLLYGPGDAPGILFFAGQAAFFSFLILMAALIDLVRREF